MFDDIVSNDEMMWNGVEVMLFHGAFLDVS